MVLPPSLQWFGALFGFLVGHCWRNYRCHDMVSHSTLGQGHEQSQCSSITCPVLCSTFPTTVTTGAAVMWCGHALQAVVPASVVGRRHATSRGLFPAPHCKLCEVTLGFKASLWQVITWDERTWVARHLGCPRGFAWLHEFVRGRGGIGMLGAVGTP
jgi:hypothetical protein